MGCSTGTPCCKTIICDGADSDLNYSTSFTSTDDWYDDTPSATNTLGWDGSTSIEASSDGTLIGPNIPDRAFRELRLKLFLEELTPFAISGQYSRALIQPFPSASENSGLYLWSEDGTAMLSGIRGQNDGSGNAAWSFYASGALVYLHSTGSPATGTESMEMEWTPTQKPSSGTLAATIKYKINGTTIYTKSLTETGASRDDYDTCYARYGFEIRIYPALGFPATSPAFTSMDLVS